MALRPESSDCQRIRHSAILNRQWLLYSALTNCQAKGVVSGNFAGVQLVDPRIQIFKGLA